MIVECKDCQKGIEVDEEKMSPGGGGEFLKCNSCQKIFWFEKLADGSNHTEFDLDKEKIKSCSKCERRYYDAEGSSSECKECSASVPSPDDPTKIERMDGETDGPEDDLALFKEASQDAENTAETLAPPTEGDKTETDDVDDDEFGRAKTFRGPDPAPEMKKTGNLGKRVMVFLFLALLIGGGGYFAVNRIQQRLPGLISYVKSKLPQSKGLLSFLSFGKKKTEEKGSVSNESIKASIKNWRSQYDGLNKSAEEYSQEGWAKLKTYTHEGCKDANANFIKAYIKGNESPAHLAQISLALSCRYDQNGQIEHLQNAAQFADLALVQSSQSANTYLAKGETLFLMGEFAGSTSALQKALKLEKEHGMVQMLMGRNLLQKDPSSKEGHEFLHKSFGKDPSLVRARTILARNLLRQDQPLAALDLLNQASGKKGRDSSATFLKARALAQLRKFEEAKRLLSLHLAVHTNSREGHLLMSQIIYRQGGEIENALRHSLVGNDDPARAQKGTRLLFHQIQSNFYLEHCCTNAAVEHIEAGLALAPDDPYLRLNQIRASLKNGNLNEALSYYSNWKTGAQKLPSHALLYLSELFTKSGEFARASEVRDQYLAGEPKLFFPYVKKALRSIDLDRNTQARILLESGIVRTALYRQDDFEYPLHAPILEIDEAALGEKLQKEGKGAVPYPLVRTAKALLLLQGGSHRRGTISSETLLEAEEILQNVVDTRPRESRAHYVLGVLKMQTDRNQEAKELLLRADQLDPKSIAPKVAQSRLLEKEKKIKDAKKLLGELDKFEELKVFRLMEMGNIARLSGQNAAALDYYRIAHKRSPHYFPLKMELWKARRQASAR